MIALFGRFRLPASWAFIVMVLGCLIAGSMLAFGQEAAPVVAEPKASGWDLIWGLEQTWKALGFIGTALVTWLFKRAMDKDTLDVVTKEALALAEQAVIQTYLTYVQGIKAGKADGSLSAEEAREARRRAMDTLFSLAKGPALKLLEAWGRPRVEALIQKIVAKHKAS